MKKIHLAAVCAALLAAFSVNSVSAADLARKDKQFIEKAAESGYLEIEASRLAETRASHADVKSFAQMMVTDHTAVDTELKSLASSKSVTVPTQPTRSVKSKLDGLGKRTGADFDKAYADNIGVDAHKDAVKLFENTAKDAKDPDIKAFAAKTLPSLKAHLEKGQALKTALKDSGKASARTSSTMPMGAPATR
jgi:putative membrane protein